MIRAEATNLADKITRIWPRGAINLDMWTEVLEELHYGPAEAAIRRLRDTADAMPSIAQFRHGYHAELGTAREDRVDCPKCGGDGWQNVHNYEVNGEIYSGVKPCSCRNGKGTEDVYRRIIEANDAELAHHGRGRDERAVGPPRFATVHPIRPEADA